MNSKIENLYQEIGRAALTIAEDLAGKILVYVEADDGVISADMFYVNKLGVVRFRFCPEYMQSLLYSLWENWRALPNNREWRVMCFVIDAGKFSIDFIYPDQISKDDDVSDRRPIAIKKHFNDMKIDYSQP